MEILIILMRDKYLTAGIGTVQLHQSAMDLLQGTVDPRQANMTYESQHDLEIRVGR